jgi:hypothetical protein
MQERSILKYLWIDVSSYTAQGMRENFISNETSTPVILNAAWSLHDRDDWPELDCFMGREYSMRRLNFIRAQERTNS